MSIEVGSSTDSAEAVQDVNTRNAEKAGLKVESKSEAKATKALAPKADAPDTSEDADDQELGDGSSEDQESKDGDPAKPRNKWKKRIDGFKSKLTVAQQETEYWRQQALKGQAPPEKVETPKAQPKAQDQTNAEPDPDDFDSHRDYVKAVVKFERDEAKREEQAASEKESRAKSVQTFAERYKTFSDETDDFEEVIESVQDVKGSETIEKAIIKSELGPQLMYELAKNKDELLSILKHPPDVQLYLLSQIEDRLRSPKSDASEAKPEIKKTKAPAPITPVGGKAGASKKTIFDADLTAAEYAKLYREQKSRKG